MLSFSTAVLIGAGKSNLALAEFLTNKNVRVTVYDRKKDLPLPESLKGNGSVTVFLGKEFPDRFDADMVFLSPSIRRDHPKIKEAERRGIHISSEIELFFRLCPSRIIAVTGSDGKTTTSTMTYEILRNGYGHSVFLAGNIGTPAISLLNRIKPSDICVIELSSFQLMGFSPKSFSSVITNITENHLNWHTNMNEYISAKMNVYNDSFQPVINYDDPRLSAMRLPNSTFFSIGTGDSLPSGYRHVFVDGEDAVVADRGKKERLFCISDMKIGGLHNVKNALAASALCLDLVPHESIENSIVNFCGVEHRAQNIGSFKSIKFIESSIDSTPSRTAATLSSINEKCIVICGGADKNTSMLPLTNALGKYAKAVIFTGACGKKMESEFKKNELSKKVYFTYAEEFDSAVNHAIDIAHSGDTVVLSPAATSFDSFNNYTERAERFVSIIKRRFPSCNP